MGHDWGGNVAWHMAHAYPDMVKALVSQSVRHALGWP